MIGTYKIYKHGELVRAQKNLITDLGRRTILDFLAGQNNSWSDFLALGTSAVPVTLSDRYLGFEFLRAPVAVKVADFNTDAITMKAEFYDPSAGWIYELGLFPTNGAPESADSTTTLLSAFNQEVEPWSAGVWNEVDFRLGSESLELATTTGTTLWAENMYYGSALSQYTPADILDLAYFTQDTNASLAGVRLHTDENNYFEYTFVPQTVAGYHVQSFTKGDFIAVGTPDWNIITSLSVGVQAGAGGGTTVQFDGLAITTLNTYADYGVVSRAVLDDPLYKEVSEEIDVEYVIQFSV